MNACTVKAFMRDYIDILDIETACTDDPAIKKIIDKALPQGRCYIYREGGMTAGYLILTGAPAGKRSIENAAVHPLFDRQKVLCSMLKYYSEMDSFEKSMKQKSAALLSGQAAEDDFSDIIKNKLADENPDFVNDMLENEPDHLNNSTVEIVIRKAVLEDRLKLKKIESRVFGDNRKKNSVLSAVKRNECLLSSVNNEPGGFITFKGSLSGSYFIEFIAVKPSFRRMGIAAALISSLEQIKKVKKIDGTTSAVNDAMRKVFEKKGFRIEESAMKKVKRSSEIMYSKFVRE